jgi:hypothetical protein
MTSTRRENYDADNNNSVHNKGNPAPSKPNNLEQLYVHVEDASQEAPVNLEAKVQRLQTLVKDQGRLLIEWRQEWEGRLNIANPNLNSMVNPNNKAGENLTQTRTLTLTLMYTLF